jgi:methylmalonyl-CoA decarboxylase subunit alpha
MGAQGAIEVLNYKEISEFETDEQRAEYKLKKEEEYKKMFANPYQAAKYGFIDDIIEPRNTRFRIIRGLSLLQTKKDTRPMKKHGNIPL